MPALSNFPNVANCETLNVKPLPWHFYCMCFFSPPKDVAPGSSLRSVVHLLRTRQSCSDSDCSHSFVVSNRASRTFRFDSFEVRFDNIHINIILFLYLYVVLRADLSSHEPFLPFSRDNSRLCLSSPWALGIIL